MSGRKRKSRKRRIIRNRIIFAILIIIFIVIITLLAKSINSQNETEPDYTASIQDSISETSSPSLPETTSDMAIENTAETAAQKSTESITAESTTSADAVAVSANGFSIETINGVTYVDGVLIANKTYPLPSTFIPTNPAEPVTSEKSTTSLDKDLMEAWNEMLSDATKEGLNLYISSGYRSYSYQTNVYNRYVQSDGAAKADTYSSRPGYSEHQTGLCFDLNTIEDSFQYTDEGKWVNDNCYKYGFCIRFPKGKEAYTGYQYESWHLRYVGVELAARLYNNGDWISLEEYFGITSEYSD